MNKSSKEGPDNELLLPFEQKVFQEPWKEYFRIKRQNWLATLQSFPNLWSLFVQLDGIFVRGLSDCYHQSDDDAIVPLVLFIRSHRSIRIASEIAFASQLIEAMDLTRSAIESAAIAHRIHREPSLGVVWLKKNESKQDEAAFTRAFEKDKKKNLFPDSHQFLKKLHEEYTFFSEFGTHATDSSLALQYKDKSSDKNWSAEIRYVEDDQETIVKFIFAHIQICWLIENTFHDAFKNRLSLDHVLQQMRVRFGRNVETVRNRLKGKFGTSMSIVLPQAYPKP